MKGSMMEEYYEAHDGNYRFLCSIEGRFYCLGEMINSLISAGLVIEFLHEFPFAARAKFSFMEQREDGWWYLPEPYGGTIPFLFSLQARKPV